MTVHDKFLSHYTSENKSSLKMIIVHGAGSFGHHSAKEYGLRGLDSPPTKGTVMESSDQRKMITGLAKTRNSVKKLNGAVVSHLIEEGVNAVGISPCINIPGLMAHGGNETGGVTTLVQSINECLAVGLVPVIHGDAGLYGYFDQSGLNHISTGILGGDTLVEIIATHEALNASIGKAIFLTDVEGVYTKDPNSNDEAILIRKIEIDSESGEIMTIFSASGSSHEHDVTGGLKTKLGAAANIAKSGIEVIIAKCCSASGGQAVKGHRMEKGTVIKLI